MSGYNDGLSTRGWNFGGVRRAAGLTRRLFGPRALGTAGEVNEQLRIWVVCGIKRLRRKNFSCRVWELPLSRASLTGSIFGIQDRENGPFRATENVNSPTAPAIMWLFLRVGTLECRNSARRRIGGIEA
jgi:hypothetical protein